MNSDPEGPYKAIFEHLKPILQFYEEHHKGPQIPTHARFMGMKHTSNVTITFTKRTK